MMSGERDARVISYICEKGTNCGGLADRFASLCTLAASLLLTGYLTVCWA